MITTDGGLDLDTIAAIATPSGRGGVSIVRISGPQAWSIAQQISGKSPQPRVPTVSRFMDAAGAIVDEGIALLFKGPASFTGEDVAELHGHGGILVTQLLLTACLDRGARLARPGEFSERAFLNNKFDLTQAESLADLIDARTEEAARQASASLRGVFSDTVNALSERVIAIRVYVEAAIDFPEEDIDFLTEGKVSESLDSLKAELTGVIEQARQGAIMGRGARVVLTGAPNAGKSSLLNCLAKNAVAIVTDVPGTTRDVIRQSITLGGVAIDLSDTAGIRDAVDAIEQEGINRAKTELDSADMVIEVIDDSAAVHVAQPIEEQRCPVIRVFNKIDLSGRPAGRLSSDPVEAESDQLAAELSLADATTITIALSASTGEGVPALENAILENLGMGDAASTTPFSARERHVTCLQNASALLDGATTRFLESGAGELLAEDLRDVHHTLSEITGEFGADALLGEIFSSFCIGK
ncbi:MAG: tRNA uridine-5-carboxymethylaminomethyl(34) synthesis GTPase MnmE [Halieaceae bacterium]